MNTWGVVAHW